MVSVVWTKRTLPRFWKILSHKGASNLKKVFKNIYQERMKNIGSREDIVVFGSDCLVFIGHFTMILSGNGDKI